MDAPQLCRRTGALSQGRRLVFNDITSVALTTAVAGLAERQRVTANNIANLETPGFHASEVTFESSLADAIRRGSPADGAISATPTRDATDLKDNNVSLDSELITATETGLQQKLITGTITSRFAWIQTVAKV